MRDTNARTAHSMELRKKTSAQRRERILNEGGLDFRALIDAEYTAKLETLINWRSRDQDKPITKTELFKQLIDQSHNALPANIKKDQLDLFHAASGKGSKQGK